MKVKHIVEMTTHDLTVVIDKDSTADFQWVVYEKVKYQREWTRSNAFVQLEDAIQWAAGRIEMHARFHF